MAVECSANTQRDNDDGLLFCGWRRGAEGAGKTRDNEDNQGEVERRLGNLMLWGIDEARLRPPGSQFKLEAASYKHWKRKFTHYTSGFSELLLMGNGTVS